MGCSQGHMVAAHGHVHAPGMGDVGSERTDTSIDMAALQGHGLTLGVSLRHAKPCLSLLLTGPSCTAHTFLPVQVGA
jgi:hypothetical protein